MGGLKRTPSSTSGKSTAEKPLSTWQTLSIYRHMGCQEFICHRVVISIFDEKNLRMRTANGRGLLKWGRKGIRLCEVREFRPTGFLFWGQGRIA